MKLAILGATGRTGVEVVRAARARGHVITALVRDPRKGEELLPADVTVVEGDLTDAAAISRLVAGADAVVDVSGPVKGSPDDLRRRSSAHLVAAMEEHGVKRLVLLTGAGVRVEGDSGITLGRADLADFLLDEVEQGTWSGRSPVVSW